MQTLGSGLGRGGVGRCRRKEGRGKRKERRRNGKLDVVAERGHEPARNREGREVDGDLLLMEMPREGCRHVCESSARTLTVGEN